MAMTTLYNFPTFHSLSSRKLFLSCPLPLSSNSQIKNHHHQNTILASASKKPSSRKNGKNVKSNEDLVNDIREFLYSVGLQDNRVPSIKELSLHGRQDLANIVRRRGYKLITELLQNSTPKNIDTFQDENLKTPNGFEGQNKKIFLADDEFSSEAIVVADSQSGKENDGELKLDDQSSLPEESATLSLQEKVSRFMQHGVLDTVEDISFGGDACEPELALNQMQRKALSSGAESLNGSVPSSAQKVDNSYNKRRSSVDSWEDLDAENMENEAEVERLKFMLHQKEIELTRLKQQIENEKLALSVLQTKAETEINKAQKLVTEKETELLAAEESLSGLKEVEIHYFGDGETVELAGSFNGWDQRIKLDLQSSPITDPDKSTTSRLWGAVLWLYPGVYEIKFIIDGHWRIDPKRESVTSGSVNNNILRVR